MRKNINIKIIITFLLFSMPICALMAQKNLDSMIIISVGEYKPTIVDANKINDNPTINDSTQKIPVSAYGINSKKINTGFDVDPIKPAQMVGEPLTKLYNALVKLGMGTYTTPYGELWFNNLRSKEGAYGVRLKHLSSSATLKDYGYSGFSDNEVSLYGKKFLKEHSLMGNFDYARNVVHFYGYDKDLNFVKAEDNQQRFNYITGNAQLVSHYTDPKRYNHDVKLSYYNLADHFKASENNIKATGFLQTAINKEVLKVNASVDYYNYKNKLDTVNNTIVALNPNFISTGEKYRASIGFTATMDNFVKTKFYFYPNVDLSYNVIDDIIIPYAGLSGGLQKNSLRNFTTNNPFVLSELKMMNSNKKYEVYGGIKGTLSSTTSFNARASYSSISNMALFVNDTLQLMRNKFDVIYDDASLLNIRGEVSYQQQEKLRISLRGEYFNYKMKTESRAWYKPQVELTLSANYNLREKIVVRADLFYIDNQFAKTFVSDTTSITGTQVVAKELKGVFDANIGLEYRYNKKLGFFLNFNNIANYRYYRWSNYPTQKFSLMGGLSYSF
ncbi:MAG: hypothetical protein K8R85_14145 [Bacteroidetes bacterium]|nr:hypothetical protein [Bacteroidota bacterium]